MDPVAKVLVLAWVTWLVTIPLCCLAHEVGHAWAVWRQLGGRSVVIVGRDPALLRIRCGPCLVLFHPLVKKAECVYDPRGETVEQARVIARAGPLANLALALLLAGLAALAANPGSVLFLIPAVGAALSGLSAVVELIPYGRGPDAISDGRRLSRLHARDTRD